MKLMGEEGVIDDGAYVLMYASLMNKLETSEFESAACFLQYSQTESAEELTEEQILAMASVKTYIGTQVFVESVDESAILCKSYDQLNLADLQSSDSTTDLWTLNTDEPLGFSQTYTAPSQDGSSLGSSSLMCSLISKRTAPSVGYAYKTGETIGIKAGFKIRESEDALTSINAYDKKNVLYVALTDTASSAVSQIAATSAMIVTALVSIMF